MDDTTARFLINAVEHVAQNLDPEGSLIGLKLEDEQVDSIMAEFGRLASIIVISQGDPAKALTKQAKAALVKMSGLADE